MPSLQNNSGLPERCTVTADGSYAMTLLPGDGKRIEWAWNLTTDTKLPVGIPFAWSMEAGVSDATTDLGHEWSLWQWHAPLEAGLETANSSLMLIFENGIGCLRICYEYSKPFDNNKKVFLDIATGIICDTGKMYRWDVDAQIAEKGYIKVRRDGVLLADYVGPVGYNMVGNPYYKAGIYKWFPLDWTGRVVVKVRFPA